MAECAGRSLLVAAAVCALHAYFSGAEMLLKEVPFHFDTRDVHFLTSPGKRLIIEPSLDIERSTS
jgi:hypothetical protein